MTLTERILKYNAGRNADFVKLKYAGMRETIFRFYRGTAHIFNEDIPAKSFLLQSPHCWITGDLHLENLGSYKADNRLAYFDLNDFDECIMAPSLIDVARFVTSIFVASEIMEITPLEAKKLANIFVDTYAGALSVGYIRMLEQETAQGIIKELLDKVGQRTQKDILQLRTYNKGDKLKLNIDNVHTIKADKKIKELVARCIHSWAAKQNDSDFYEVKDVAHRIAGTGSLGINRFIILVNGKGKKGGRFLLDMKQALPSSLHKRFAVKQPKWENEASRVVEVQKRVQSAYPALLHTMIMEGVPYVLKEMQPTEDKIGIISLGNKMKTLEAMIKDFANLCAWGNLRSGGRDGSSIADDLIAFGKNSGKWKKELVAYTFNYSKQVKKDFIAYCKSFDAGLIVKVVPPETIKPKKGNK